jgi:hypothetical protein
MLRRANTPSSMFLKEKFNANGSFDKLNARLVAGGHRVNKELYTWNDTSSPTICLGTLMMVLSLSVIESRDLEAIDFPGAYLYADLEHPQLMRLDKELSKELVEADRCYTNFLQPDGTVCLNSLKRFTDYPKHQNYGSPIYLVD